MNTTHPTLLASLKALPRPAWILFLGVFLNKFGSFVVPFLTLFLTRQGYSMGDAGLAIGAYGAGHFLASGLGDTALVNDQTYLRGIQHIDAGPRHGASFVLCDQLVIG